MLALLGGLRGTLAAIAGLVVGLAAAWLAFSLWNAWVDNPAVRDAARQEERTAWEEATRKLRDQLAAERRAAQARIDQVEQAYLDERRRDALLISDLETAIATMEAEDADTDDTGAARCRPALPRGLGLQLDKVGR